MILMVTFLRFNIIFLKFKDNVWKCHLQIQFLHYLKYDLFIKVKVGNDGIARAKGHLFTQQLYKWARYLSSMESLRGVQPVGKDDIQLVRKPKQQVFLSHKLRGKQSNYMGGLMWNLPEGFCSLECLKCETQKNVLCLKLIISVLLEKWQLWMARSDLNLWPCDLTSTPNCLIFLSPWLKILSPIQFHSY